MDYLCDYDEGFTRSDAYDMGWCKDCRCSPKCPMKRRYREELPFSIRCNRCDSRRVNITALDYDEFVIRCSECDNVKHFAVYTTE